ncbi:MAG: PEGA domain-containing protein [Candidatus Thiodiazotropha sp. (ex Monitilora ramsayi)]|nr:PEGA domain-containing protein [Candidatus Thiodiazotropha sp. (ex Monitilora ramsayi)]
MKIKLLLTASFLTSQALLSGCTGIANVSGSDSLSVKSNPSGAQVYVMDKLIGETPIEISQTTLYPNTYDPDKEALYGVVVIKKEGCRDHSQRIGYRELIKSINADLTCGSTISKAIEKKESAVLAPIPQESPSTPKPLETENIAPSNTMSINKSAKRRLIEINQLKEEGLISEGEFQSIRQRILQTLY